MIRQRLMRRSAFVFDRERSPISFRSWKSDAALLCPMKLEHISDPGESQFKRMYMLSVSHSDVASAFKYACVGPLVHYFTVHRSGVFVPMLFYADKRRPARTKDIVLEQ